MPSEDRKPHTLEEIRNSCEIRYGKDGELLEVCRVSEELIQGIDTVSKYDRLVSIYGSARFDENHPEYINVRKLAYALVKEAGVGIISGGSRGIMEGAKRGAYDANGISLGATIVLPKEQHTNPYASVTIPFEYFFTRKTVLRYSSEMAVYCPGGYGTLDELFDLLTLIQTNKIKRIPVVLFGSEFWTPLYKFIKETLVTKYQTIGDKESELFIVTDSIEEIVELAKKTPSRKGAINDY